MPSITDVILRGKSGPRWSVIGKADYGLSLWVSWCSVTGPSDKMGEAGNLCEAGNMGRTQVNIKVLHI